MVFWGLAAALTALSLALTMAPMLRGSARADRRSSYDMQIYRDQLREVEADRSRGLLNDEEAEATRIEISRRLLALADGSGDRASEHAAPARASRCRPAADPGARPKPSRASTSSSSPSTRSEPTGSEPTATRAC